MMINRRLRLPLSCYFLLCLLLNCSTSKHKAFLDAGNQLAKDGLLQEAVEAYKKGLEKSPNRPIFLRNLGIILVKLGDYKNAIKHLKKAYRSYEQNFDTNFFLAEAYRSEDKYAQAIFHYEKSLRIRVGDLDASRALAWSYYKIRYYQQTIAITKKILAKHPDDTQTLLISARTHIKLRRFKKARALVRKSLKKSRPEQREYFQTVQADILMETGQSDRAKKIYQDVLKGKPLLPGSLYGLGRYYLERKNWKKAVTYLERAIRVRPHLTEAYQALGKAYEKSDLKKSIYFYRQFYKMASKDPVFIPTLSQIKVKIRSLKKRL